MIRNRKKRGQSTLEFLVVIMFILGAFLVFQKYIVRGISGRWKGVGDTFASGRLYDPDYTTECAYVSQGIYKGKWYDADCYYEHECNKYCLPESVEYDEDKCNQCFRCCASSICDGGLMPGTCP